jgi:hypothetical protein
MTFSTCRFCREACDDDGLVRYAARHYAHFECYLDAGKSLTDLHSWQVGQFPYMLLKQRGLIETAERLTINAESRQ